MSSSPPIQDFFGARTRLDTSSGSVTIYRLDALEKQGLGEISRLPYSIRIMLEAALRLAHPIIPFITEELWQKVAPLAGRKGETAMLAPYPRSQPEKIDEAAEREIAFAKDVVNAARNLRSEAKVPPKERVAFYVTGELSAAAASAMVALALLTVKDRPEDVNLQPVGVHSAR